MRTILCSDAGSNDFDFENLDLVSRLVGQGEGDAPLEAHLLPTRSNASRHEKIGATKMVAHSKYPLLSCRSLRRLMETCATHRLLPCSPHEAEASVPASHS